MKVKKVLITLALIPVVISACMLLYILIAGRDAPEPDVNDLKAERIEVAPDENAFSFFSQAIAARYWPREYDKECVTDYLTGDYGFDDDFVRRTLERNAETFRHLREGVDREACLVPEEEPDPMAPMPHLSKWRDMGRLLAVKVRFSSREGDYETATEACVLLLRFGDIIKKTPDTLIHYLVGVAVQAIGLNETRLLLHEGDLSKQQVHRLFQALESLSPPEPDFVRAMKGEYQFQAYVLEEYYEFFVKDFVTAVAARRWRRSLKLFLNNRLLRDFLLQPNRTKKVIADGFRKLIDSAGLCYAELELEEVERLTIEGLSDLLKLLSRRNPIGRLMSSWSVPAFNRVIKQKLLAECERDATRIVAALHAYYRFNGSLPETLDALVPEFLYQVPQDPYDGAPFRYDRSLDVVYSVGENLEDHGGRDVLEALADDDWRWLRYGEVFVFSIGVRDEHFREKMAKIAEEHEDGKKRRFAIRHVTDQSLLSEIVLGEYDNEMRVAAAQGLTDQSVIKELVENENEDAAVRRAAVGNLKDLKLLLEIAEKDEEETERDRPQIRRRKA